MPLAKYNAQFGGNAAKAHGAMTRTYGKDKGRSIFYALKNKRKKQSHERQAAQGRFFRGR